MKKKMKNKKNKKTMTKKACLSVKQGFSLIEALVAVSIFALAMVMVAGVFSTFLKNYSDAKKTQRSFENAQYAMNLMAKTIRTSALVTTNFDSANPFVIFDYSQARCIEYKYLSSSKKIQVGSVAANDPTECTSKYQNNGISSFVDFIPSGIQGVSIAATATSGNNKGKATIAFKIQDQNDGTILPIEMTVSLRQ